MLIIGNGYEDRDITITPRERSTGQDGQPLTLKVGDVDHSFEIDGDHEWVISTRAREPGEERLSLNTMSGEPLAEVTSVSELTDEEKAAADAGGKKVGDKA